MTKITGTNVSAPIAPNDTADTYPTHHARYGKGGWRTVATIAERDAIPADRLEPGSVAYVVAEQTPFIWQNGIWTDFVATQDHLDHQAVKWATYFIGIQAMLAERWSDDWK